VVLPLLIYLMSLTYHYYYFVIRLIVDILIVSLLFISLIFRHADTQHQN